jgi:hypothetical protein
VPATATATVAAAVTTTACATAQMHCCPSIQFAVVVRWGHPLSPLSQVVNVQPLLDDQRLVPVPEAAQLCKQPSYDAHRRAVVVGVVTGSLDAGLDRRGRPLSQQSAQSTPTDGAAGAGKWFFDGKSPSAAPGKWFFEGKAPDAAAATSPRSNSSTWFFGADGNEAGSASGAGAASKHWFFHGAAGGTSPTSRRKGSVRLDAPPVCVCCRGYGCVFCGRLHVRLANTAAFWSLVAVAAPLPVQILLVQPPSARVHARAPSFLWQGAALPSSPMAATRGPVASVRPKRAPLFAKAQTVLAQWQAHRQQLTCVVA